MATGKEKIPSYSLDTFDKRQEKKPYQVEVFDAHRHFQVTYPHRHHDFYEILFLTKGSGLHVIDFKAHDIRPNSLFFLSPGQVHNLDLSKDVEGYIFLFRSEFYQLNKSNKNKLLEFPFFHGLETQASPLYLDSDTDAERIKKIFVSGCDEIMANQPDESEMVSVLLDLLLLECRRLYPQNLPSSTIPKGTLLVKRFKQLIDEHYLENLSVRDYAEKLSITPSHLTETVRELTGKTSNELIKQKVILEAKRLLVYSEMTVTEIAHQLNFKDQSYFTRLFRQTTKLTPLQFREKQNP